MQNSRKGFTLIELLVVIVIIGLLASIVFVAIDPAQRFADVRDARRRAETVSLLNAILKYQIDHDGDLPAGIDSDPGTAQVLGTAPSGCDASCTAIATEEACLDVTAALVDEYLASIPMDPDTGTVTNTDYYVNRSATGRITIGACDPESAPQISISR